MEEFYVRKMPDGSEIRYPATRWRNETTNTVTMDLSSPDIVKRADWKQHLPKYEHGWQLIVRIQPNAEMLLPSEFDYAIQQTHCQEPRCSSRNRMFCRDATHHVQVIGGLGPWLKQVSPTRQKVVHPSLIVQPDTVASTTAGPQLGQGAYPDRDAEAKLMARARAARGGAK